MKQETLKMSAKERERLVVLRRHLAGELTLKEAAWELRVSPRQALRIKLRFVRERDAGLLHRGCGRASNRRKPREALDQVSQIESANGRIDHGTLPEFARTNRRKLRRVERYFPTRAEAEAWSATQICAAEPQYFEGKYPEYQPAGENPRGRVVELPHGARFEEVEVERCRVVAILDEGMDDHRNLGALVTMYGECIKALKTENDQLRARVEALEAQR